MRNKTIFLIILGSILVIYPIYPKWYIGILSLISLPIFAYYLSEELLNKVVKIK